MESDWAVHLKDADAAFLGRLHNCLSNIPRSCLDVKLAFRSTCYFQKWMCHFEQVAGIS